MSDLLSLTGAVSCTLTPCIHLGSFLDSTETVNKQLLGSTADLVQRMGGLAGQLYEYSALLRKAGNVHRGIPAGQQLSVLYSTLGDAIGKWADFEQDMSLLAQDYLQGFFELKVREATALKELWAERDRYLSAFEKAESRLKSKKERLWTQRDVSKWELADLSIDLHTIMTDFSEAQNRMLPAETAEVEKIQQLFGYFNSQVQSESLRVLAYSTQVAGVHFGRLAGECDQRLLGLSQDWRDFFSVAGAVPVSS